MPAVLNEIVANKRAELAVRKANRDIAAIEKSITPGDNGFARALAAGEGIKLICELKPKSPSAGVLRSAPDVAMILKAYDKYATAISVLTDEKYFGGSLELLKEISDRSPRPTLCKDFIIDPYQCFEAREAGAQAVLLVVKILNDLELKILHEAITNLGMTPVVEVQTESELTRALALNPQVILINNRDLSTFDISFETTKELAPLIPSSCIVISASGVATRDDVEVLSPYCSNFLIGSSLMIADDLTEKLAHLSSTETKTKRKGSQSNALTR